MIEILKHTPPWVFVLFFVLLAVGYFQSKDRAISRGKVSILPVAMIVLSFHGVLSAFGAIAIGLVPWVLGVAIAVGIGVSLAAPKGVGFSTATQRFLIPGSWLPLAFMMAIFFTKYLVGVIMARQLPIAGETSFIATVSLCYGLLSGVFLARAIVIWRSAMLHRLTPIQPTVHAD
ncbi:MAG: hypothetical protein K9K30_10140 [Burkholderiaceae bacterium]|nr:hypothetical protein [Sulfuritalea sp.]MCF8175587.1 hypothetical protein [Burkholderiaceae bacterium]